MYFKHYYYYCPISLEVFQKKLFSSSLGEILYVRACLVLAVDQHVFQVFLAGNMYQKGEGVLAILFTGYPPMPIHCSNLFQLFLLKSTAILRQRFCYNSINSDQNSSTLWRTWKKKLFTGEWTVYFQWLPRSTSKDWSL